MTTQAQFALFIPLEYGQERPMEAMLQIHAVKELHRMKSQISKTKPISTTTAQPTPMTTNNVRHIRFYQTNHL